MHLGRWLKPERCLVWSLQCRKKKLRIFDGSVRTAGDTNRAASVLFDKRNAAQKLHQKAIDASCMTTLCRNAAIKRELFYRPYKCLCLHLLNSSSVKTRLEMNTEVHYLGLISCVLKSVCFLYEKFVLMYFFSLYLTHTHTHTHTAKEHEFILWNSLDTVQLPFPDRRWPDWKPCDAVPQCILLARALVLLTIPPTSPIPCFHSKDKIVMPTYIVTWYIKFIGKNNTEEKRIAPFNFWIPA